MIAALTQQDVLDLFDRLLPRDYLAGLRDPGPGYELLQAVAAAVSRASQAAERLDRGAHVATSWGGARATVEVLFYRGTGTAGSVTVKAGTVVEASRTGRPFVTTEDAVFAGASLGPVAAQAVAVAEGWEWNVPGQRVAADGTVLEGEVDAVVKMVQDPPFGDPTVQVRQVQDASGGRSSDLDGLAANRGLVRAGGEADEPLKLRIRTLPDTVSPDAIVRLLDAYASSTGLEPYEFIENWQVEYQTCWDCPPTSPLGRFDPNLFTYDDPRPPTPFRNRWLDMVDYRAAFIVVVQNIACVSDSGMVYDDAAASAPDYVTPRGSRAAGAYDLDGSLTTVRGGCYDGADAGKASVYRNLWRLLQDAKPSGAFVALELAGQ